MYTFKIKEFKDKRKVVVINNSKDLLKTYILLSITVLLCISLPLILAERNLEQIIFLIVIGVFMLLTVNIYYINLKYTYFKVLVTEGKTFLIIKESLLNKYFWHNTNKDFYDISLNKVPNQAYFTLGDLSKLQEILNETIEYYIQQERDHRNKNKILTKEYEDYLKNCNTFN